MDEYVRKMATILQIEEVKAIPEADKICAYRMLGWWVIDQVNKYQVGDIVIYFEIDAWIPTDLAPFLSKGKSPREYNGVKGEKLRTIRLRGALSQGLIMPLPDDMIDFELGDDVSEQLCVVKWEPPPEFTSADAKGTFPKYCPKSDQERIQNCLRTVEGTFATETYEVSEKVEGQSHSAILYNGEFMVCSRNLSLKDSDNTFWNSARKYDLENKMRSLGRNLMIQSEQCGPGISGNIYNMSEYFLFVFDIFDIDRQEFLNPEERRELTKFLGLIDAPVLFKKFDLSGMTVSKFLDMADGKSVMGMIDTLREGLVFKANANKRVSFKAVSNMYLLGEK